MFEHKSASLLPRMAFYGRVLRYTGAGLLIVTGALLIGIVGYHGTEHLSWIDAFLNAAMILGGMGPVNPVVTTAGKIFAGCYALFSGIVFLVAFSFILSPLVHRMPAR